MSKLLPLCFRRTSLKYHRLQYITKRNVLSEAYQCEEAWQKRLDSPLIKQLKMEQYFVETDKKFATKRLVSGVDIDLFANNIQVEDELEELEHLLYRFRKTKRAVEIMDSTPYAVVRAFLKFQQYESLFRVLKNRDSYGIFPDSFTYNILMSTFIKEKMFKEAAESAILLMLQEDFQNQISNILGLYSCQMFIDNCSIDSLGPKKVEEVAAENQEEDEEETLVRVPFLRNPWFDDHFDITELKHLIGKTFYLLGREFDDALGRSYQLIGLAMYNKWEKAENLLNTFSGSSNGSLFKETIEKVQSLIQEIPEDDENTKEKLFNKFDVLFKKMQTDNKIILGSLLSSIEIKMKDILNLQEQDIEVQKSLYSKWEDQRKIALEKQNAELEIERRQKSIEEKKEYLFWKEKLLFFFENEEKNLDELKNVEEMVEAIKSTKTVEETYVVPEMVKNVNVKKSIYKKLANVKKI